MNDICIFYDSGNALCIIIISLQEMKTSITGPQKRASWRPPFTFCGQLVAKFLLTAELSEKLT